MAASGQLIPPAAAIPWTSIIYCLFPSVQCPSPKNGDVQRQHSQTRWSYCILCNFSSHDTTPCLSAWNSQKRIQRPLEDTLLFSGINIPKRMPNATERDYGALAAISLPKKASTTVLRGVFSSSPPRGHFGASAASRLAINAICMAFPPLV